MSLLRIRELETQLARRDARIAELEQDAARYHWLMQQAWFQQAFDRFDPDDGGMQDRFEKCVGEIIDAAMKGPAT